MRGGAGNFAQMRERSRKMEDDMFAQLHLNATQKHKIEVFRNERDAKVKKAMESASKPGAGAPPPPTQGGGRGGGGRGGFGAMRPIMKEYRDKVEGILTPDQKTKYEALRKEMRARMGGGRGGPGGPGGGPPPGGGRPGGGA
jgi:Spy/CpxP family protein refolding chaperone